MKAKSQAEIWESKLKFTNLYRILMIIFLIIAIVGTTMAIVLGVQFKNFKKGLDYTTSISVVIQTRKMPDSDIPVPEDYQLDIADYGNGNGLVDGKWKGKTLDEFLRSLPLLFFFGDKGMMEGIKGSQKDQSLSGFWWALYSPTDPSSADHPDEPASKGAPFMYLQKVNVYYFALHKLN